MMRMQTGIFCALAASLAFAVSCADSGTDEDEMDDPQGPVCGDATCAASEVGNCAADCGTGGNNNATNCGNGMCETTGGENGTTCPLDCGAGVGSGSGSGSGSSTTCPSDPLECFLCILDPSACPTGLNEAACTACLGGGGGGGTGCEGGAPDGACNAAAGEDTTTCPFDCM